VTHEPFESLRFGRVLFVELAPPESGRPDRYADVLGPDSRPPSRAHFSAPEAASRVILAALERGAAVDAVVLGGAGDPLRHRGLGSVLRSLRTRSHVATVVLTDGRLLVDRQVRRDASEAALVVAWLPALVDASAPGDPRRRADAWEKHVEAVASLVREHPVPVALELPVRPGENDGAASRDAWRRAVERVRPERVFVVPAPGSGGDAEIGSALERVRGDLPRRAGVFLDDGTVVDRRAF
jgi:hypothetical protein